jgi:hypothetical protein
VPAIGRAQERSSQNWQADAFPHTRAQERSSVVRRAAPFPRSRAQERSSALWRGAPFPRSRAQERSSHFNGQLCFRPEQLSRRVGPASPRAHTLSHARTLTPVPPRRRIPLGPPREDSRCVAPTRQRSPPGRPPAFPRSPCNCPGGRPSGSDELRGAAGRNIFSGPDPISGNRKMARLSDFLTVLGGWQAGRQKRRPAI